MKILPPTIRQYGDEDIYYHASLSILNLLHTFVHLVTIHIVLPAALLPSSLPSSLLHCEIIISDYQSNKQHLLETFITTLPSTLKALNINSRIRYDQELDYWNTKMVASLPRLLQELTTDRFPANPELWVVLPQSLTRFNLRDLNVPYEYDNINYKVAPSTLTSVITEIHAPGLNKHGIQLSTLLRFTAITSLILTLRDPFLMLDDLGLMKSLRRLTLRFRCRENNNVIDNSIVFPPNLEELKISGNSTTIDGNQWNPLPDTVQQVSLNNLYIKSLPSLWPSQLSYLNLLYSSGNNSKIYGNDKISDIFHLMYSLLALPPACIVHVGMRKYSGIFALIDHQSRIWSEVTSSIKNTSREWVNV